MTAVAPEFSIDDFKLAVPSSRHSQKLDFALQAFAKRNFYAHIYYDDFMSASRFIGVEHIDSSGNLRNKFEAYATAYIANAHAMIDSFPYVIFLALPPLTYVDKNGAKKNISPSNSNWNDNFYAALSIPKYRKLSIMFRSILENDEDFVLLRSLSNNHKHKFLTRISNNARRLRYEVIDPNTGRVRHIEIAKFFARVHNKLLPRIFKLYEELQACANK
ncbi:hypothetical protein JOD97_003282 [Duganella sp. 1411]|uniref:hypothetical protein n=1 Tax=Duganella sp. 1411 TaxID=2806572 RepID=UPI001AE2A527|nr:hypothetical protein [Duganella sp. 1411]MBP1205240.1 hypothetical protein [Duganella sp. 1411]